MKTMTSAIFAALICGTACGAEQSFDITIECSRAADVVVTGATVTTTTGSTYRQHLPARDGCWNITDASGKDLTKDVRLSKDTVAEISVDFRRGRDSYQLRGAPRDNTWRLLDSSGKVLWTAWCKDAPRVLVSDKGIPDCRLAECLHPARSDPQPLPGRAAPTVENRNPRQCQPTESQEVRDWLVERCQETYSPPGNMERPIRILRFDAPQTVKPGQLVKGAVVWENNNRVNNNPNAVMFTTVIGSWAPRQVIAETGPELVGPAGRRGTVRFEFRAPDQPGRYRLRWILPMAFKPIRCFYSQEDRGSYDPGNAWWSEKEFVVEAADAKKLQAATDRNTIPPFSEQPKQCGVTHPPAKNAAAPGPDPEPPQVHTQDDQQWYTPLISLDELVRMSLETQGELLRKRSCSGTPANPTCSPPAAQRE